MRPEVAAAVRKFPAHARDAAVALAEQGATTADLRGAATRINAAPRVEGNRPGYPPCPTCGAHHLPCTPREARSRGWNAGRGQALLAATHVQGQAIWAAPSNRRRPRNPLGAVPPVGIGTARKDVRHGICPRCSRRHLYSTKTGRCVQEPTQRTGKRGGKRTVASYCEAHPDPYRRPTRRRITDILRRNPR